MCKLLDYGKHVFDAKKDKAAAKKKQRRMHVKETKFRPGTEEGDYQVKLRNLRRFLTAGDKAKVTLRFRGREMAHQDRGMALLKRIEDDLAEMGAVEMFPKMEGRQLTMVLAPNNKKKGRSTPTKTEVPSEAPSEVTKTEVPKTEAATKVPPEATDNEKQTDQEDT